MANLMRKRVGLDGGCKFTGGFQTPNFITQQLRTEGCTWKLKNTLRQVLLSYSTYKTYYYDNKFQAQSVSTFMSTPVEQIEASAGAALSSTCTEKKC